MTNAPSLPKLWDLWYAMKLSASTTKKLKEGIKEKLDSSASTAQHGAAVLRYSWAELEL